MARFVKLRISLFQFNFLSIFSVKVECPATLQIKNTLDNMMYAYANHLIMNQLHMQAFIVLNSELKRLGYNEFRIQWEVPRLRLEVMSILLRRKRVILEGENVYENIYDDSDDDILPELLPANDDDDENFLPL